MSVIGSSNNNNSGTIEGGIKVTVVGEAMLGGERESYEEKPKK